MRSYLIFIFSIFFSSLTFSAQVQTIYQYQNKGYFNKSDAEQAIKDYVASQSQVSELKLKESSPTKLKYTPIIDAPQSTPYNVYSPYEVTETGALDLSLEQNKLDSHPECNATSYTNITKGSWNYLGWGSIAHSQWGSHYIRHYSQDISTTQVYNARKAANTPSGYECKPYEVNKNWQLVHYQGFDCPEGTNLHSFPENEEGVPICQTYSDQSLFIKLCKAPYEWEDSSLECVKYCPPGASSLDLILGICKGLPGDDEPKACSANVGNPIDTSTGEKIQPQSPDYSGSGSFPIRFSRNYKSFRSPEVPRPPVEKNDGTTTWTRYVQPANYAGAAIPNWINTSELGVIAPTGFKQWMHSYQLSLVVYPDESKVLLVRANGDKLYYSVSADTVTYTPDNLTGGKIVKSGSNWLYTDPKGNSETYNNTGQLVSITNNQGLMQTLAYDANNLLVSISDPAGRQLTLDYDSENRLSSLTDPDGNNTTYVYGNHGNLVKVIYPDDTPSAADNPATEYVYNAASHPYALTGLIDENSAAYANWTYSADGRATSSVNFNGYKQTTVSYNDSDVSVTEANGQTRTLTFDDKGLLSSVTGGNCGQCGSSDVASYSYDTKNQLTSEIDFNGVETRYEYNARGLQTKRTEAYGTTLARVTITEWHSDLSLPTKVITPTQQIDYVYGVRGRLESITETDLLVTENPTRITTYTYNTTGLLLSINGPRTDVTDTTTFAYNTQHDLVSITDGAGNMTQITSFDAHGHPTTIVDANGVITTLAYDVRNRLISQTVAGNVTSFEYDNIGQLIKITLPSGAVTNYSYSGSRLLTSMSDGQGNSVNYTYDVMGNVTKIDVKNPADTLYATQQQVFDGLNRLTSQIDGLNNITVFGYDAVGNQVSVKTPLLKETKQVYDALNRLSETTDAKAGKTTYGYDAANNLTSVKAPNNAQTTYSYDGFGNLLSQTSLDTGTTSFTYDIAGNQLSKTDAKGVTINYSYDALNRLTGIDYPEAEGQSSLDVSLAYDTGTNGKGHLTQVTDGSGTTTYSYNALGQVSSKTSIVSGKSFTVSYGYNGSGQLAQITQPSGRVINLTRDTHGQITGISELNGGVTQNLITSASYVPFGSAKSLTLGNGKTTTKTHNLNGQLTSIDVSGIYQSSLTYSSDSNITGLASTIAPSSNQAYTYDELDRLTEATGAYGTLGYSYDSASNRITKTENTQVSSLTYAANSNQLSSPYLHDANGNRTKDSKRTYSYGDNNRLTEVTNDESGVKTTYLYNGLGQRVKKSNIFGDIYFVYDEQGLLIAEADGTGSITKEYVYFEGQPLVMLAGE